MTALFSLFWSFFQIGLFSFGGGLAALPLIQDQIVNLHGWMTLGEFTDLITIAEMTPGPIAINSATFVGIHIAGLPGAVAATLGCIVPSCVIVSVLAWLYNKYRSLHVVRGALAGLRPAVVALIASAGLSILTMTLWGGASVRLANTDLRAVLIFAAALFVLRRWKPNPIFVMLGAGAVGGVLFLL